MSSFKRRKLSQKAVDFPSEENARANQHVNLPQKKRAIIRSSSPCKSPVKKQLRSNSMTNSTEEVTDDETLIREAEVALKNLSGSWPSSRNSIYNSEITNEGEFEPPAFENLFEENQVSCFYRSIRLFGQKQIRIKGLGQACEFCISLLLPTFKVYNSYKNVFPQFQTQYCKFENLEWHDI